MFSNDYFSDQFPTPYRILGLRLKPFCLGHYTILAHPCIKCAFISENEEVPTEADLIVGVLLCSKTYPEAKAFLEGDWEKEVIEFGKAAGVFDFQEKAKLFAEYIKENSAMPRYWEIENGNTSSGAHWTQSIKLCLTGSLGYTAQEVMEMPLRQAFADYFKHAESEGSIQLMSPEEIQAELEEDKEAAND